MVEKKKQSVLLEGKGGKIVIEGSSLSLAILTHAAAMSGLHGKRAGKPDTTMNLGKPGNDPIKPTSA